MTPIPLDVSKTFNYVRHRRFVHSLSSYGTRGIVFSVKKSFLSIKVIVNGQSSEDEVINEGILTLYTKRLAIFF